MPARLIRVIILLTLTSPLSSTAVRAQSPARAPAHPQTASTNGIDRIAGEDPASHIKFVRLLLAGSLNVPAGSPQPSPPPTLIAQCTLRPNGRSYFELFANFGGITDLAFYPPWTPASADDLFPPRTNKVLLSMEFLGYTHVKPVRRQWEIPTNTPGQYHYNPPGSGSANLEDISYYLRYLLALPKLRLTLDARTAEFLSTPLLNQIRQEPLCRAAAL